LAADAYDRRLVQQQTMSTDIHVILRGLAAHESILVELLSRGENSEDESRLDAEIEELDRRLPTICHEAAAYEALNRVAITFARRHSVIALAAEACQCAGLDF
jgi:hypothetical protein